MFRNVIEHYLGKSSVVERAVSCVVVVLHLNVFQRSNTLLHYTMKTIRAR